MTSHVYILQHAQQPWIKIGKADDLLIRSKALGFCRLDLCASLAVEVADSSEALRLEFALHRLFARFRIPSEQVLACDPLTLQGFSEWFHATCKPRVEQVLDAICDLLPHRRVESAEFQTTMQQFIQGATSASYLRQLKQQARLRAIGERAARQQARHEEHQQALATEAARIQAHLRALEAVFFEFTAGLTECFLVPPPLRPEPGHFRAMLLGAYDLAARNFVAEEGLSSFSKTATGHAFQALGKIQVDRPTLSSWARLCANLHAVQVRNRIYLYLDLYWTERPNGVVQSPFDVLKGFRLKVPGWDIPLRPSHVPAVESILQVFKPSERLRLDGRLSDE